MAQGSAYPRKVKDTACSLYAAGRTCRQIGVELGVNPDTVKCWAKRGKWGQVRAQTYEVTRAEPLRAVARELADLGARTRGNLATAVDNAAAVVANEQPTTVRQVKELGEAVEPLVRSAKVLHGWADTGDHPLVQIGQVNIEQVLADRDAECQVQDGTVIEVESATEFCPDL